MAEVLAQAYQSSKKNFSKHFQNISVFGQGLVSTSDARYNFDFTTNSVSATTSVMLSVEYTGETPLVVHNFCIVNQCVPLRYRSWLQIYYREHYKSSRMQLDQEHERLIWRFELVTKNQRLSSEATFPVGVEFQTDDGQVFCIGILIHVIHRSFGNKLRSSIPPSVLLDRSYNKHCISQKVVQNAHNKAFLKNYAPKKIFRNSLSSHADYFSRLLDIEEMETENSYDFYTRSNVNFTKDNFVWTTSCATLQLTIVESVNDCCIKPGDEMLFCPPNEYKSDPSQYTWAIITNVDEGLSLVEADMDVENATWLIENGNFHVLFWGNRYTMEATRIALNSSKKPQYENYLFPEPSTGKFQLIHHRYFNENVHIDEMQRQAVSHIISKSSKPAPYLLFGPPGTGKTTTIVEAIKQVSMYHKETRLLVCAPSNSAADLLAKLLIADVPSEDIFRFYSLCRQRYSMGRCVSTLLGSLQYPLYPSRNEDVVSMLGKFVNAPFFFMKRSQNIQVRQHQLTLKFPFKASLGGRYKYHHLTDVDSEFHSKHISGIPKILIDVSNIKKRRVYRPKDKELMSKRVIICTLARATRFATSSMRNTFTHLFVDEAGFASEPVTLVAIMGCLQKKAFVVLSGDHKQLQPVVKSTLAKSNDSRKHGLNVSFFERLMGMPLYELENSENNGRYSTMLKTNRRSNPTMITIPNELFYDGQMQSGASAEVYKWCKWKHLPQKGFPIIFHDIISEEQYDESAHGYYNEQETQTVVEWVKKIKKKTQLQNLGIITPYNLQENDINNELYEVFGDSTDNLKIGSVEKYQGQEKDVIILSTVRAAENLTPGELGFISNPNRFNVAITRAKSLLIVIGCSRVLKKNKLWANFIEYIEEEGGYIPPK